MGIDVQLLLKILLSVSVRKASVLEISMEDKWVSEKG